MRRKTLRIIVLFCLLTALSTAAAAADNTLSVTRVQAGGWNLLHLTEKYAAPDYLEKIAGMLPQTAVVTLSGNQTVEVSLRHAWTPDPDNSRWINSISLSDLPSGAADPDGVLNTLSVAWQIDTYTGSLSASPQFQIIGQTGSFSLWRYMSGTDRVELWQIPADGGSAVLRATQDSGGYSESGNSSQYAVDAWTAEDSGEWFGLYYRSSAYWNDAYLSGTCSVETGANKVTRAAPNGWTLFRMTERYAAPEYLNIIADMLPQTVTVTLLDKQTLDIPTQGTWTPDPDNSRWINSADASALPEGTEDPDGVLNTVSIAWQIDNYTGGLSISPSKQMIGQEGSFTLGRYMLGTSRVEFWQVPADGGPAVLRGTQDSKQVSDDGHSCKYAIDAWKAQDAGQWIGLYGFNYYSGGSMYLAGVQEAAPRTYTVTFRPGGGALQGPELYQTVFDGNAYHLENTPPDPVRTNYQFEGWYTQSNGGESISVTPQADFTADIVLYAHWSRLGGTVPDPAVSDGKELQTVETTGPSGVRNRADNGYSSRWASPIYANLYRNPDGSFVTIDSTNENGVIVTFWNRDFQQADQKQLSAELPIFGGFFHGETYNYLVFGQENPEEDDTKEVFRIVKYDQNFNRISAAAVRNCYTCIPFDAGSCRMAESGNHLTVHTARERYLTSDGLHHQSQLTIVINTDTMEVENDLGAFQDNHVSHSFNQFVLYDGEDHVLLDHGDAYPRSVILQRPDTDSVWGAYRTVNLLKIPGPTGENWTGVSVGGFAQSDEFYLAAINTVRQDQVRYAEDGSFSHTLDSDERDVVLLSCSKYMDSGSVRQDFLTDHYQTGTTAGTPYLVPMGENRYAVLWQEFTMGTNQWGYSEYESRGVRYAVVNGNADLLTDAVLLPGVQLSRYCQPVADGDSVIWYVDTDNARIFYRLSLSGDTPADPTPTPTLEPTIEPTPTAEPEIQSVVVSDSLVTVALSGSIPADAVLFAAAYRADGQFVRASSADVTGNHVSVPLATEQGMFVRVFLLDQSFRPVCPMKQPETE